MNIESVLTDRVIYFDNAATSYPKPDVVPDAMARFMMHCGGNPGRSGHRMSMDAGEMVFAAREAVASFFGIKNPMRIVFTLNATEALNLAIQGILSNGGHAVTSSMEHNSTARPLKELEKSGKITLSIIPCTRSGVLDIDEFIRSLRDDTKLVALNHGSNAFGTVLPIFSIGTICKKRGITLLLDAAQTADVIPINCATENVDLLAFSGHKGLLGPTGTGGLMLAETFDFTKLRPLVFGGTGSNSDSIEQPDVLPDRYESGTLNAVGLAGLAAGISFIQSLPQGISGVYRHKKMLVSHFLSNAKTHVKGFIDYVHPDAIETGVVSFNLEGILCSEVSQILSEEYGIMSRSGLHCAPLAHQSMGTFPEGTVRFSFGIMNTKDEVLQSIDALSTIAKREN